MKILIDLGNLPIWKKPRMLALAAKPILEATTLINQIYIKTHQVPPLYQSGVRYANEPAEWNFEDFAIIPAILERGWGDCDDLAPWRVAELRQQGEKAKIRIQWKTVSGGSKLYHIVVRRGPGVIVPAHMRPTGCEDPNVEDPSLVLGMGR